MTNHIELSWQSVIKFFVVGAAIWLIWLVRDIIALVIFVVIIVAAFSPIVDRWAKKMHRGLAVTLIYLIFAAVLALIGLAIIPPLVVEIQGLAENLPTVYERLFSYLGAQLPQDFAVPTNLLQSLAEGLQKVGQTVFSTTKGVIGGLFGVFSALVLSFYLLLEPRGGSKFLLQWLPLANRERIAEVARKIGLRMGGWLRGQLILALTIAVVDFIILAIIGVPYALTLAILAGVMEFIPYIGPVVAGVPAVALGFALSPVRGLIVLLSYILVQQLESNVLVPKIMGKAVGLSPVIIILAILIGAKLAGFLGVVLGVPAAAAVAVMLQEWPNLKKKG